MNHIWETDASTITHALISWCVALLYLVIICYFTGLSEFLWYVIHFLVGNVIGTIVNGAQEYYFSREDNQPLNWADILAGWLFKTVVEIAVKIKL